MIEGETPEICRQVWDRAVEGRDVQDVMTDDALAAHVGSCMTCFRTLAELRDAPRLAAALRADAPAVSTSDRFWDDLATRTTAAAAAALADSKRRPRRRAGGVAAMLVVAAAAAWVLFAGRAPVGAPVAAPGTVATTAGGEEEETGDEGAEGATDIQDLDEPALQRLLARLRTQAPTPAVSALAAVGDAQEAADAVIEDDVNEALAELDGAALLRVERSLAGASL
jgi:hypothetical protein